MAKNKMTQEKLSDSHKEVLDATLQALQNAVRKYDIKGTDQGLAFFGSFIVRLAEHYCLFADEEKNIPFKHSAKLIGNTIVNMPED